ncbi:hypothetical protein ACIQXF_02405 [Lysinibacillus sp. NPDC097231]|uniref:hypothetical protein n=1 Tax=Lysinibacillus sp. NPDC097231 TaxID=3364142 RepID=UPI00382A52F2
MRTALCFLFLFLHTRKDEVPVQTPAETKELSLRTLRPVAIYLGKSEATATRFFLCESEATATRFFLCESEATATRFFLCESEATATTTTTTITSKRN